MTKKYAINMQLRNYIERLQYETVRYEDLLNTVNRDCCPMTDEEWNSSWEYFSTLHEESLVALQIAKETVNEIYSDIIENKPWYIDFDECVLVVGSTSGCSVVGKRSTFNERLDRMYFSKDDWADSEDIGINSKHAKDITIQVTDACNMACTYCYQHQKSNHVMTFETAREFIDMLLDADEKTNTYIKSTECSGFIFNFIGGEPWLGIDLITKISDYIIGETFRRKHPLAIKFVFGVCSNGLLHFDERVQKYIGRHMKHLGYSISIDGNKELHDSCRVDLNGEGTYDRAIKAVGDYSSTFGGYIGSKMTLAPENIDKMFTAVVSMIEYGYREINLNCVYEEGWTTEHASILYDGLCKLANWLRDNNLIEQVTLSIFNTMCGVPMVPEHNDNWCGGNGRMLAVDYKGDMFPCIRYMESSVTDKLPAFIIGNLKDGINCNQEHKDRIECLGCITRRSQSTDECFNCPIAQGCGWCSAYNYETYGTPDHRATFICVMHKARSLANVYYWRLRGEEFPLHCPKEWAVPIIGEEEYEKLKNMEVVLCQE